MIFILFSYLYLTDSSSLTTNSQTTPTTPSSPLSPETVNIVVVVVVVASFIVGFAIAVAVYLSSQVPGVSQAASTAPSAFVSAARRSRQNMAPEIYAAYSSWNPFHVSRPHVPWYTPRRAPWADININESNTDLDLAFRDTSAVNRRKRIWRPMNQLDLRPSVDYFAYRLG